MIHIERSPAPPDYREKAQHELDRARRFFESPSGQRRFDFDPSVWKSAKPALLELFHGKCAYCERSITTVGLGDIELYRPKGSIAERPDHPGYWWLSAEWNNLFIICQLCDQSLGRRNHFPLEDEEQRAFTPEDDLSRESPILLNPCDDHPEEHLIFTEDGRVVGKTERGITTISVLYLNRIDLVDDRRMAAQDLRNKILVYILLFLQTARESDHVQELRENIERSIGDDQEYAGMKRQLISSILEEIAEANPDVTATLVAQVMPGKEVRVTEDERQRAKESTQAFQRKQEDYSLKEQQGREMFFERSRFIEGIKIHNMKAIHDIDLDLTTSQSNKTPWLMLLGENATGKSTILHAVALTLIGAEYLTELISKHGIRPSKYVRYRCKSAYVQVKLSGFRKPHTLTFFKNPERVEFKHPLDENEDEVTTLAVEGDAVKVKVKGQGWKPQTLLLGYGATRLLPRRAFDPYGGEFARVDNLFDPFIPLFDAERWLLELDENAFNRAALVLKDLLQLDDNAEFKQGMGNIKLVTSESKVPLSDLSDGYQSSIAMTIDILEVFSRLLEKDDKVINFDNAEGIVLLDEVGAHLHPRWKMRIVASLRKALPGVQFIATTHQPLCLRGLAEGEIVVIKRDQDNRIVQFTNLPDPREYRVDQLLTSRYFGLLDTFDPELEVLYDEYYHLKALGEDHLVPKQKDRLNELRSQLKDRNLLGATRREELMYEVIDELLAREHVLESPSDIDDIEQEAVTRIRELWRQHLQY